MFSLQPSLVLAFLLSAVASAEPAPPPDPKELDADWTELAGSDAVRAYRAICRLAGHPKEALPFLRTHLRPVPMLDEKAVTRLIASLDSENFEEREKAQRELERFGEPVGIRVRKTLATAPSPEAKRRLETVLQGINEDVPSSDTLRHVRAVEALERMGTKRRGAWSKISPPALPAPG